MGGSPNEGNAGGWYAEVPAHFDSKALRQLRRSDAAINLEGACQAVHGLFWRLAAQQTQTDQSAFGQECKLGGLIQRSGARHDTTGTQLDGRPNCLETSNCVRIVWLITK